MPHYTDRQQIVALLDADPDLRLGLDREDLEAACSRARAAVISVEPPAWDPTWISEQATEGWLGLFVLEGLLLRHVVIGSRPTCELVCPGWLIRPWDTDSDYEPLPISADWLVLKPTRLAVLDTAFVLRCARWPSINGQLVARAAERARYLALTQGVTHLPRANVRLLILFWLLAERLGRVGTDGVHVELPVTHEVLAMLVGAHRPTVTIALQRLTRARLLVRERPDLWLLTNRAIDLLGQPDSFAEIGGTE